jgi:hypothetical protein
MGDFMEEPEPPPEVFLEPPPAIVLAPPPITASIPVAHISDELLDPPSPNTDEAAVVSHFPKLMT